MNIKQSEIVKGFKIIGRSILNTYDSLTIFNRHAAYNKKKRSIKEDLNDLSKQIYSIHIAIQFAEEVGNYTELHELKQEKKELYSKQKELYVQYSSITI